ncbi:hypothetical protein STEG23_019453, partial [Scotinomys teguina]
FQKTTNNKKQFLRLPASGNSSQKALKTEIQGINAMQMPLRFLMRERDQESSLNYITYPDLESNVHDELWTWQFWKSTNNKKQFQRQPTSENSSQKVSEAETLKASMPCRWQMHEGLQAFYQKKSTVKNKEANLREKLMTSSRLESVAEMPQGRKGEQQISATSEMLHVKRDEPRRKTSGLHGLRKVSSEQSSSEQQRQQRSDCFQDHKSGDRAGQTAGDMQEPLIAMEDSRPDLLSSWTVSGTDFLNNESCLLLAALIYLKEKEGC